MQRRRFLGSIAGVGAAGMFGGCLGFTRTDPKTEAGTTETLGISDPAQITSATSSLPKAVHDSASETTYLTYVEPAEGGGKDLFLKRSSDGGETWSEATRVNETDGFVDSSKSAPQQLDVATDGTLCVSWDSHYPEAEEYEYGKSSIRFARSTDGGRSFEVTTVGPKVDETPATRDYHNLAVAPDGKLYVATLQSASATSSGRSIRVMWSTDGGRSWTSSAGDLGVNVDPDSPACPCCRPALAAGSDGTVYVSWRKVYPSDEMDIRDHVVAYSTDGGRTWGTPVKFYDHNWHYDGCPHSGPDIGLDGDGRLHATWFSGSTDDYGVYYGVSTDHGRSWPDDPVSIFTPEYAPITQPALHVAPNGDAWVAYEGLLGENSDSHMGHTGTTNESTDRDNSSTSHGSGGGTIVQLTKVTSDGGIVEFSDVDLHGHNPHLTSVTDGTGIVWRGNDKRGYFSTF
ncbi:hypothetical protein [Halovivax limisalsi]|uniref:hypothetical protein n=1 Tax=Halovivax limisalsi TaxID=1453760 RepID=UPI001FFD5B97|nr:hypothetical protein [Halovivax limisalsi]